MQGNQDISVIYESEMLLDNYIWIYGELNFFEAYELPYIKGKVSGC